MNECDIRTTLAGNSNFVFLVCKNGPVVVHRVDLGVVPAVVVSFGVVLMVDI